MSTPAADRPYWLGFARIAGVGPATWHRLLEAFPTMAAAWTANSTQLTAAGIRQKDAQEICDQRATIDLHVLQSQMEMAGISMLTLNDDDYPPLLRQIHHPPAVLFYRGSLSALAAPTLAVVGTRRYSSYGKQVVTELVQGLATRCTILSGLALGIDALAHQACLEAGGVTISILGSGIETARISPVANQYLSEQILDSGGALISEYPVGTPPGKFTFPLRNRIIAGLSLGTLVIEAPESSGALITARYALEFNRSVLAVPGSIFSDTSRGTNELIRLGAIPVTKTDDVISELQLQDLAVTATTPIELSADEQFILNKLSREPLHIDTIAQTCNITIMSLSSTLMLLEMKGAIKDLGGNTYIRMLWQKNS